MSSANVNIKITATIDNRGGAVSSTLKYSSTSISISISSPCSPWTRTGRSVASVVSQREEATGKPNRRRGTLGGQRRHRGRLWRMNVARPAPADRTAAGLHATTPNGPVEETELHPSSGGSGTGSRLLHYFSMNRVDSRGLRWIPVDSATADKRLTSNVLEHKLRVVSQLPKHARTGSTPCPPGVRHSSAAAAGRCVRCTSGRTTSAAIGRTFTCQSIGVSARFSSVIVPWCTTRDLGQ